MTNGIRVIICSSEAETVLAFLLKGPVLIGFSTDLIPSPGIDLPTTLVSPILLL